MIRLTAVLMGVLAATAAATEFEDCNRELNGFLPCLKDELDDNFRTVEDEYIGRLDEMRSDCFATSESDGNRRDMCKLSNLEFKRGIADRKGDLLRSCRVCKAIAKPLENAFLTAPENVLQCMREKINAAAKDEIAPCIQRQLGSRFAMPDIPDFDEKMFLRRNRPLVYESTSKFLNLVARLEKCKGRKPRRGAKAEACMADPKYSALDSACETLGKCKNKVSGSCKDLVGPAHKKTCECIGEIEQTIREKVDRLEGQLTSIKAGRIPSALRARCNSDANPKSCACQQAVKSALRSRNNDWMTVGKEVLTCTGDRRLTVDRLLAVGCDRAVATKRGKADLVAIFKVVRHFIDAMTSRVRRFCDDDGTCHQL